MSEEIYNAMWDLRQFMFDRVYTNPACKSEEGKAIKLIQALYEFFVANPNELPNEYITIAWQEGAERAACDYIAGMTDDYVLKVYGDYFIPRGWNY